MHRIFIAIVLTTGLFAAPAFADSITGSTIGPGNTVVTGPNITSTNSGPVTATGNFSTRTIINGGHNNTIGVSAVGAGVTASISRDGGDPNMTGNDTIVLGSITATNTGSITATGNFNRTVINGGSTNGVSVSAAGTQVTLSIAHR